MSNRRGTRDHRTESHPPRRIVTKQGETREAIVIDPPPHMAPAPLEPPEPRPEGKTQLDQITEGQRRPIEQTPPAAWVLLSSEICHIVK
jgi:hypothetical protein